MKQIGEPVVLAIPGQNRKIFLMKRVLIIKVLIVNILIFISSVGLFAQEGIMEKFLKQDPVDSLERVRLEYEYTFAEGAMQKMQGNIDLARENYFRCMELRPERSAPYYELSSLIFAEGDYETARIYANQAIRLDPQNHWYLPVHGSDRYLPADPYC